MKHPKSSKWLYVIGVVIFFLVVGFTVQQFRTKPTFAKEIYTQNETTLLVPISENITILPETASFDSKEKVLTYKVQVNGVVAIVSEQPTPEHFIDFPDLYEKLVNGMQNYKTIEVEMGKAYLTRPKTLNGKQAATMNTKGTLMFVKPESDLSDKQWNQFFRSLEIDK